MVTHSAWISMSKRYLVMGHSLGLAQRMWKAMPCGKILIFLNPSVLLHQGHSVSSRITK